MINTTATVQKTNKFLIFLMIFHAIISTSSFFALFESQQLLYYLKYLLFSLFLLVVIVTYRGKISKSMNMFNLSFFVFFSAAITLHLFYSLYSANYSSALLFVIISVLIVFSVLFLFPNIDDINYKKILLGFLVILTVLAVIPGFFIKNNLQYYYIIGDRSRFLGLFGNPNEFGRFCLLVIMLSLQFFYSFRRKYTKVIMLIIIASSFYMIILADSRASLLVGIIGIALFTISHIYAFLPKKVFYALSFVVFGLSASSLMYVMFNFSAITGITDIDEFSSGRLSLWSEILNLNTQQLFFGVGSSREGLGATQVIVNGYIETILYFGVIGSLFWFSLILYLLTTKVIALKKVNTYFTRQGLINVLLFLIYTFFEGGLTSIGNILSVYFWLELSRRYKNNF